jgi:hypothetical protein
MGGKPAPLGTLNTPREFTRFKNRPKNFYRFKDYLLPRLQHENYQRSASEYNQRRIRECH